MRATLLAAFVAILLPVAGAQALSVTGTIQVSTTGDENAPTAVLTGAPITAAPGDSVTITFQVAPEMLGATAYLFAFSGHGGVALVGPAAPPAQPPGITNQLPGGLASSNAAGTLFSFNNALATDLPPGFATVAVLTVQIDPSATLSSGLTLTGDSTLSTLKFLDAVLGPRELLTIVPEPGTAALLAVGAIGLAIARRRA